MRTHFVLLFVALVSLSLSACGTPAALPTPTPTPEPTPVPTATEMSMPEMLVADPFNFEVQELAGFVDFVETTIDNTPAIVGIDAQGAEKVLAVVWWLGFAGLRRGLKTVMGISGGFCPPYQFHLLFVRKRFEGSLTLHGRPAVCLGFKIGHFDGNTRAGVA